MNSLPDLRSFIDPAWDRASESIIVTDLTGTIVYWNSGATQVFGYDRREMLGRSPTLLYPDQDPEELAADLAQIRGGQPIHGHWRGRHKNGQDVWVDVATTLLKDPSGRPVGIVGRARDISRAKVLDDLTYDRHRSD